MYRSVPVLVKGLADTILVSAMPSVGCATDTSEGFECGQGLTETVIVDGEESPELSAGDRLAAAAECVQNPLLQAGFSGGVVGNDFEVGWCHCQLE